MADERFQLTRVLPATPAEVFEAWTRPEILSRWFAPGELRAEVAELDPRPGGRYRVAMHHPSGATHVVTGSYREVVPPERLVFSWAWEGEDAPETLVTVEFRPVGDNTEMLFTHEGFPTAEARDQHLHGWTGSAGKLAELLAAGS